MLEVKVVWCFTSVVVFCVAAHASCSQGTKLPVPNSCDHYQACVNGTLMKKSCGILKRFDRNSGKCVYWWKVTCSQVECLEGETAPVAGECSSYRKCADGKWKIGVCHFWKKFHPKEKLCTYQYDCKGTPVCDEGARRSVEGKCKEYEECTGGAWKRTTCGFLRGFSLKKGACSWFKSCPECAKGETKPLRGECSKYLACTGERWEEKHCGLGRRFDHTKQACRIWFEVECPSGCKEGTKMAGSRDNSTYRLCSGGVWHEKSCGSKHAYFDAARKECRKKEETHLEAVCSGDWKQPFKADCQKYLQCVKGRIVLKSCTVMMRFDPVAKQCKFGWFVKCDNATVQGNGSRACAEYQRKPVLGDCKQYYECQNGGWDRQPCLLGREFDAMTLTCRDHGSAVCAGRDDGVQGLCKEYERKPLPGSAEGYEECQEGKWIVQYCLLGGLFDPITLTCKRQTEHGRGVHSLIKRSCKDGTKRAVQTQCWGYEVCSGGIWDRRDCPSGLGFDSERLSCSELAGCSKECQDGEISADVNDCHRYTVCSKGKYEAKKCEFLHVFDAVKGRCVFKLIAVCSSQLAAESLKHDQTSATKASPATTKPSPATTKASPATTEPPTTQTPTVPDLCPSGTIYPVQGSCKDYIKCDPRTGKVQKLNCRWCQNFHPEEAKCVYAWKYRCDHSTTKGTTTTEGTSTTTTQPPSCTQEGQKVPIDCKNYKQCQKGKWVNKKCGWTLNFDKFKLKCKIWATC